MGMFGLSKKDLQSEISGLNKQLNDQNEEFTAEVNKLRGQLSSQEDKFRGLGALDHLERTSVYEKLQHDLERLQRNFSLELNAIEEIRRSKMAAIDLELADRKAKANAEFERLTFEINTTLSNRRDLLAKENAKLANLKKEVIGLESEATLQNLGFYDYDSPAKNSVQLYVELTAIKNRIKEMLKDNSAAYVADNFTFDNSAEKGKRFANDMRKLMLKAYNAEAENAIKSVRAGNQYPAIDRLDKTKDMAERLGKFIQLSISQEFHNLRLKEIDLANSHLLAVRYEKERERELKAAEREQQKVEAEIKREIAEREAEKKRVERELEAARKALAEKKRKLLEKERDHYGNVIQSLDNLNSNSLSELQADEETLQKLQDKFDNTESAIKDLISREANTRAGYVYVLSNIGAFGEDIVKIGMTRRLDPSERVKELSGASVPFVFDAHLMVFSEDARGLEHKLHQHFSAVRVNKINMRKEYFRTTPESVLEALKSLDVTVVEFKKEAEASDYREGLAMATNQSGSDQSGSESILTTIR